MRKKRIAELKERISEQSILIRHQETLLAEKGREIALKQAQMSEMTIDRERKINILRERHEDEMREKLQEIERLKELIVILEGKGSGEDQVEVPTIIDEWVNGEGGDG